MVDSLGDLGAAARGTGKATCVRRPRESEKSAAILLRVDKFLDGNGVGRDCSWSVVWAKRPIVHGIGGGARRTHLAAWETKAGVGRPW